MNVRTESGLNTYLSLHITPDFYIPTRLDDLKNDGVGSPCKTLDKTLLVFAITRDKP